MFMLMSALKYGTSRNTPFKTSKTSTNKFVKHISEDIQQKNVDTSCQYLVVAVIVVIVAMVTIIFTLHLYQTRCKA